MMLRAALCAGLIALAACGGGGGDPVDPGPAPVASVTVSPPTNTLAPQETVQLTAVLRDAAGTQLTGRTINWTASPSQSATVSSTGLVTAIAAGVVTVTATSEGKSGSAQVTVVAPVATVVVSATTTTLVPQQSLQLTVVLQDAGGAPLTGRPVTWTSSQAQVATVSTTGLVTALATGSTTITATSEGKSGTIALTVVTGSVVGPTGGTLTAGNGSIEVTVPPGAVSTATPITLTALPTPTVAPPANVQFNGPVYELGPPGLTFTQPVTVKLKYDVTTMPHWAMTGDLTVYRSNGTQWNALTDIVVDVNAGTVSGKTTAFGSSLARLRPGANMAEANGGGSNVTTGVNYASVTLTPNTASVNFQQRSVSFHAHLVPVGNSIPIPAPGVSSPTPQWKFRWRTTGQNGVLGSGGNVTGWTTSTDEQYIATNAVLDQLSGPIDIVYVDVLLNPAEENNPSAQRIVTRQVTVDADLETTYEISPANKTIGAGAVQNFQLVIRDKAGNILQPRPNSEITWQSSANHGTLNSGGNQPTATYTAKSTFAFPPPRVDDVEATIVGVTTVTNRQVVWDFSQIPPKLQVVHENSETRQLQGKAKGFVTVKVDYQLQITPTNNTISVGGTQQFQVTLTPPYSGPGIELKSTTSVSHGTLSINNTNRTLTYSAKAIDPGGTDQIGVEVVSVVGGTQLESLGMVQASIDVDPWRNGFIGPNQIINQFGNYFTSAQIRVAKVTGATTYEVKADTPDGLYTKTFSGATSTNQFSVGEVLDGGSHWLINIEAGFNTIPSAADARWNLYLTKYNSTVVKYKAT